MTPAIRFALLRRAALGGSLATATAAVLAATPAMADGCKMDLITDFPVTMEGPRAVIPAIFNGQQSTIQIDSGAFYSTISAAKVKALGLKQEPMSAGFGGMMMSGVGGTTEVSRVVIKKLEIGGHTMHDIGFLVGGSDTGDGLLGRNILANADNEFDLAHGSIKIIHPTGCGQQPLAYWTKDGQYFTAKLMAPDLIKVTGETRRAKDHPDFKLRVLINGHPLIAELDSGAGTSVITIAAARRVGIDVNGSGAVRGHGSSGIGSESVGNWVANVATVDIGQEQIQRTRLEVLDGTFGGSSYHYGEGDDVDMLLGADWLMSHHVYVARGQQMIYFSYTGGEPFRNDLDKEEVAKLNAAQGKAPGAAVAPERLVKADADNSTPTTADAFYRRGAARLAMKQYGPAIADLGEAIRMAPDNAEYYRRRAAALRGNEEPKLARADFDKAMSLDPHNGETLVQRGLLRPKQDDHDGAIADADAAARIFPAGSLELAGVATLYEDSGAAVRAIPLYDAMIALHREDSSLTGLYNGRCWARGLANVELAKAMDDCNRAARRSDNSGDILDSRGLVRFRQGDYPGAIADYNAALRQSPKAAWSMYMRGATEIKSGKADAGAADMASAVAIDPKVADRAKIYGI